MADTVRGRYELSTTQARQELRSLRRDADLTERSVRRLGQRLDGLARQSAGVKRLRTEFRGLARDAVLAEKTMTRAMSAKTREVEKQIAAVTLLRRELKRLGQDRAAHVDVRGVEASVAKVELLIRKLKELDRQRATAKVGTRGGAGVLAGNESRSASRDMDQLAASTSRAGRAFSFSAGPLNFMGGRLQFLAAAAAAALPAINALIGSVGALAGSLSAAGLGAGALGVSGLGALGVGVGSIVAAGKPAATAVGNVVKAQQQLRQEQKNQLIQNRATGQSVFDLQNRQQALTNAVFAATQAQKALTQARRDAVRAITDLRLANERASLSERQAALAQRRARFQLAQTLSDPTATASAIEEARIGLQSANLDVESARIDKRRAGVDYRRARRKGVARADQVVQARQGLVQARQGVRQARRDVRLGGSQGEQLAQDRSALQQLLRVAPPGTANLIRDARHFRTTWRAATRGAQGDLVQLADVGVLTGQKLQGALAGAATRSSAALLREGRKFGTFLRSGLVRSFIRDSAAEFDENLGDARRIGQNMITVLMQISRAARPFVRETMRGLREMTGEWRRNSENTLTLRDRIGRLYDQTRLWFRLTRSTFHLLRDLFSAGTPAGGGMVSDLTHTLDRWDSWVRRNPIKVRMFFREAVRDTERLATGLGKVVAALFRLGQQLEPLIGGFSTLTNLVSPLLGSLPGLTTAYGAYRTGGILFGGRGGGKDASGRGGGGGLSPTEAAAYGAAGGVGGSVAGRAATAAERAAVGRELAFQRIYGRTIEGARYGTPELLGARAGRLTGLMGRGGRLLGAAGRAFAPIALLQGGFEALSGRNPLTSSSLGGALAKGAMYGAAAGEVLPFGGPLVGAAVGAAAAGAANLFTRGSKLGLDANSPGVRRLVRLAQARFNRGDYGGATRAAQAVQRLATEMPPDQKRKLTDFAKQVIGASKDAATVKLTARGSALAADERLATERITRRRGAAAGLREFHTDFAGDLRKSTGAARTALKQGVSGWIQELANGNAAQRRQARAMERDVEATFKAMGQTVRVVNGNILTGSRQDWSDIEDAIGTHAELALERSQTAFTNMQKQALGLLEAYGYSRAQARRIVTASESTRGDLGAAAGAVASGQRYAAMAAASKKGRARGGRMPGSGLADTVRMADGGFGAPGELVLNRHQEADADRDLIRAGKPPLWMRLLSVRRPHSAPMRAAGGYAPHAAPGVGGGLSFSGHPSNVSPAIRNLIRFMERRFPQLTVTSTTDHSLRSSSGGISYHSSGRAVDMAASPEYMNSVARWINESGFYRRLSEGIHNPTLSVKNGQRVPAGFWGPLVWGQHLNHIHLALAAERASFRGAGLGGALPGRGRRAGALRLPSSGLAGVPGALANAAITGVWTGLNRRIAGAGGGGGLAGAAAGLSGGTSGQNQRLGRAMMLAAGWGANQWPALKALWNQESGWNANAVNRSSGAYGIPQSLGHGHPFDLGDARAQIAWGLNYIRGRYHSPSAAWAHEKAFNWYSGGGRMAGPDFGGWYKNGGAATFRRPTLIGVGDGQASGGSETVIVAKNGGRGGRATRTVHVAMNFGDVHVRDHKEFESVIEKAANRAGEKLLAALDEGGL